MAFIIWLTTFKVADQLQVRLRQALIAVTIMEIFIFEFLLLFLLFYSIRIGAFRFYVKTVR